MSAGIASQQHPAAVEAKFPVSSQSPEFQDSKRTVQAKCSNFDPIDLGEGGRPTTKPPD